MNREVVMPPQGVKTLGMSWKTKEGRLTCGWRELEDGQGNPDATVYDVELNQASATESKRERKHLRVGSRSIATMSENAKTVLAEVAKLDLVDFSENL